MTNTNNMLPSRENIPEQDRWHLNDIYDSEAAWEADFVRVKQQADEIKKQAGTLGQSSGNLLGMLNLYHDMMARAEKIYGYARMHRDEDNTRTIYQSLADRAQGLFTQVQGTTAFMVPEILAIPETILKGFLKDEKDLRLFARFLDELTRQKTHILSEREEELLARAGEVIEAPDNIFSMLNHADLKFPTIKDESGAEIEITHGRFIRLMESHDRRVRKEAFDGLYATYESFSNTLATTLSSQVKTNAFLAGVRKYPSSLEAALDDSSIPAQVYDNLIETVKRFLEPMYRYVRLRKKLLGVDEVHLYDIYAPLVKDIKWEIPYAEGVKLVQSALAPLGKEYGEILAKGLKSRWVDVYENRGKTSGAYSWGVYGVHPFILLNYHQSVDDVFTLAHEMGHALHSYYTNQTQPYVYSHYKIFVAEVASTVNEALLMHYLLEQTQDRDKKRYLLNHYLEQFRGTLYRQTMFAEFEKITHQKVESGQPLTAEGLKDIYHALNTEYYGPDMVVDQAIDMEWARIPHFYSSFYVYQYATGYSAAIALSRQIIEEGEPAVARYLQFLKGGNADTPLNLLKQAGVDMASPEPIAEALTYFEKLVDEMEKE